jgi:predicted PurR-regulated permease PerM
MLHLLEANLITPVVLGRRFTLNPVVILFRSELMAS